VDEYSAVELISAVELYTAVEVPAVLYSAVELDSAVDEYSAVELDSAVDEYSTVELYSAVELSAVLLYTAVLAAVLYSAVELAAVVLCGGAGFGGGAIFSGGAGFCSAARSWCTIGCLIPGIGDVVTICASIWWTNHDISFHTFDSTCLVVCHVRITCSSCSVVDIVSKWWTRVSRSLGTFSGLAKFAIAIRIAIGVHITILVGTQGIPIITSNSTGSTSWNRDITSPCIPILYIAIQKLGTITGLLRMEFSI